MGEFVYVDNSNVFIEGKRVSAVKSGRAIDIRYAIQNNILDHTYRLDFGKLYTFVAGSNKQNIKRAVLFGSRPPQHDSLWNMAERAGFETVIMDRNKANREKKIDTGIVALMIKDAYKMADRLKDTITLVAGDGDFLPAVDTLCKDGYKVEVVFWHHASNELKQACSRFVELDNHLSYLSI